ncbi:MAG TPA: NAD(P)/FAD-dependent oxidoreductase [Candidatus Sulfotelmatobacter sp.]|nr:NAD(P)/FAD-dependent oxidoreductase [Candidatus Sulfotelmatobacter sp.]
MRPGAKISCDAVVVGAGPNGLAAAIRMAREKLSVLMIEANETVGGGARSAELTLPGFVHDVCSAVHPLAVGSPFFRQLPLEQFGLKWIEPEVPLAHSLDGGWAAALYRSLAQTAKELGPDQRPYERLMQPLVSNWENLAAEFLKPMLHVPRHPVQFARFGLRGMLAASSLARGWFSGEPARALFGGLAAHAFLPLEQIPSAAFGLVLGMTGHAVGWPMPRGGAQQIANALAAYLKSLSGEIVTGWRVENIQELPKSHVVLLDLTPRQLLPLFREKLPSGYRRRLEHFSYGPGVFKMDFALDGPIPWTAEVCRRAGTVHVCGTLDEIARSEREAFRGEHPERPFVLLSQPSLFDSTRAPEGKHSVWAYCHVPHGSSVDMAPRIEAQIERFAPGFRDRILARHAENCADLQKKNANLIGGSINGGANDLRHLLARPIAGSSPYRMPIPGYYICSSSTPPGGGVHGMCGYYAAETAIGDLSMR